MVSRRTVQYRFYRTVTWYKWTNQIAQLRQVYNIIQILDGGESTIQFMGRRKAIMDEAKAESIIAFLRPVNCIVDELPSNSCYIIHYRPVASHPGGGGSELG